MVEEYEFEELADMAINELRVFIDTETQFIIEEHQLIDKLQSWDYIIGHLDERIPANMKHLHQLNTSISEKLIEIRDLIESGELFELKIEKEEKRLLKKLKKDVKHREWKAVKQDIEAEKKKGKKTIRLETKELRNLHSKIIELMKIMKRSKLIKALEQDLTSPKQKEEYEKAEEYYYTEIYKFLRAYERIFRHLWEKELILARELKSKNI